MFSGRLLNFYHASGKGLFSLRSLPRAVFVMTILALVGAGSFQAWPSNRLPVVASILPLGDFARNVGGDRVGVTVLIPPGSSPHIYEPTPARAKMIATARVLVLNGLGLEFWADKLINAADNPTLIVVRTAEGLEIIEEDREGHKQPIQEDLHRPQHPQNANPHVWLDPLNAIQQIGRIRDAIIQADPGGAEIYRANADRYVRQLENLDQEIRETIATFGSRKFISFHAGFSYFVRRYGLERIAVVERTPGREPSPKEIADIVKAAREFNIKAIFAEPQFPPKAARVIAEECGAEVLFLNPLGDPPDFDYLETMRRNLRQLAKAMSSGK